MSFIGLKKPKEQRVSRLLEVGDRITFIDQLKTKKPFSLINFLRHPGCPFAEQNVKQLRQTSMIFPNIDFFVVSHGDKLICDKWINSIGGIGSLNFIHDEHRELYGLFGLGYTNFSHFMGIRSLFGVVKLLFKGIRNRTASGTRWQSAGSFLIDSNGIILWKQIPTSSEEIPNYKDNLEQLKSCWKP